MVDNVLAIVDQIRELDGLGAVTRLGQMGPVDDLAFGPVAVLPSLGLLTSVNA